MTCDKLFYDESNEQETLHERTKLSKMVLNKGIAKKDELLCFLRSELSEAFECEVKFWIQGSYKSHTLIKPVDKYSSYDIDVGVYLFFDAESEGIEAFDVKETLREGLKAYCDINNECELQKSKNACEGLKYTSFLTIDTPIYYKTDDNIKLATDNGWINSDPKSIQDWITNSYDQKSDRALMKRLVRYFKSWANIKWNGTEFKKIPSLALNVLVANHMKVHEREDDSFIHTALSICEDLESIFVVNSPLDGSNLIGMAEDSESFAHQKFDELKNICASCLDSSEYTRSIEFSNLFEHYFPQIKFDNQNGSCNFPAIVTTPNISICRYDKNGVHIETVIDDEITVKKGDSLTFTICNHNYFNFYASAQWTVRNVGEQATDANDIGHKVVGKTSESHKRGTTYTGSHTMECLVSYNGNVEGFKSILVKVRPHSALKRKPIFKGWRR